MFKSFYCPVAALALVVFTLFPSSARAVNVTVGGIPYDIVFFQGPESFADNQAVLTNTATAPWWGEPQGTATAFRDAYNAAANFEFDVDPGATDVLIFAFNLNSGGSNFHNLVFLRDNETGGAFFGQSNTAEIAVNHYAYVNVAASIPEIDGGALGQGAVILFALWLMLRRRGAGVSRCGRLAAETRCRG